MANNNGWYRLEDSQPVPGQNQNRNRGGSYYRSPQRVTQSRPRPNRGGNSQRPPHIQPPPSPPTVPGPAPRTNPPEQPVTGMSMEPAAIPAETALWEAQAAQDFEAPTEEAITVAPDTFLQQSSEAEYTSQEMTGDVPARQVTAEAAVPAPNLPQPQAISPNGLPIPDRVPPFVTLKTQVPPHPMPPHGMPSMSAGVNPGKEIHSQTVGERGPVLMQDTKLHETLEDFVHSTRLGRVVHTKGFGAFGHFQSTHSMAEYTRAPLFQGSGEQVPVAVRFSLAVSNHGTPDSGRNVRGFSTKFFTGQGVFDLLCNHIPVFLVRDAIRFPDSIRAFQVSPKNNLADPDIFWGFVATAPEATNFVTWLYSDLGTIKSLRKIRASSVNTYVWQNAAGKRYYVKYHWIPLAGEEQITAAEAVKLAGENPDVCGQDLYNTIAAGIPVEYELRVQIMDPAEERNLLFDPLDCTKVWDEARFPLMPVGKMTLNRNPDDYQEQVDKLAFNPANLMDGIEFSPDKMLQGRTFIYSDAQRHRLGNDYRKLPANAQKEWIPNDMIDSGSGETFPGVIQRSEIPISDDFAQAGQRYHDLSEEAQDHLVENIAGDLANASASIRRVVLVFLHNASQELGERVSQEMQKHLR